MKDPFAPWVVALTHSGFGGGAPLSGRDWWPLFDPPPGTPAEIASRVARSANPAIRAMGERHGRLAPELESMEAEGIVALTMFDEAYPAQWAARLGPRTPPAVFLLGDVQFLALPAIAIVGSRGADEAALEFTADLSRAAAAKGLAVVTGGANGVDRAAIVAATRAGGAAVVVTADAFAEIHNRLLKADVDLDFVLLVTPNHPTSGWSVGKAMGRNKLIYAFSEAAAVAACEANTGGTWTGAIEALKMGYARVFAWTGSGAAPGNRSLAQEGAIAFERPDEVLVSPPPAKTSLFD